ncbi:MAG: bacterial Ig-like domain-containing protein [Clostridia bacterium]|nr:bacterial Ig-like domain-containing protein [Clostridia bacterium]
MKKLLALALCAVMVLSLGTFAPFAESGTILIGSYAELAAWASNGSDDAGKIIKLTADIVANDKTAAQMKSDQSGLNSWTSKPAFAGTFDGQGHSIYGLYMTGSSQAFIYSFDGTMKDVFFLEPYVKSNGGIAVIAQHSSLGIGNGAVIEEVKATYINVYVNGIVDSTDYNAAGFQAERGARFTGCWFDGRVNSTGNNYYSAFVANQQSSPVQVTDCLNTGSINVYDNRITGGFSGGVYNGKFYAKRCLNTGTISFGNPIFSILREGAEAKIESCCALSGSFTMNSVSWNSMGTYTYCYESNSPTPDTDVMAEVIADPADLFGHAEFADTWGSKTVGDNTIPVPAYFADEPFPEESYTIPIGTYAELVAWASNGSDDADKLVVLTSDITANDRTAAQMKQDQSGLNRWIPKPAFTGTFDGQGHSISGLYMSGSSQGFIGTFDGTIKNLFFIEPYVNTPGGSAVVAHRSSSGSGSSAEIEDVKATYINVYVNGIVDTASYNAAGFQSQYGAKFTGCWFDGTVNASSNSYFSGFVGNQQSSPVKVTDCLNTGTLNVPSGCVAGGFSGGVYSGRFYATRCVGAGSISFGNPIFTTLRDGSVTKVDQCYAVSGSFSMNTKAWNSSGTYTYCFNSAAPTPGTDVEATVISSCGDVSENAKFADTWGLRTVGGLTIAVPKYFAEEDFPTSGFVIEISSYEELLAWASNGSDDAGKNVILTADIVANAKTASQMQANQTGLGVWTPKPAFAGTFDGQGHSISGLYMTGASQSFIISLSGTIQNVSFIEPYLNVSGYSSVVARAGTNAPGTDYDISSVKATYINVYVNGIIDTTDVDTGGFQSQFGAIFSGCWFDGTLNALNADVIGYYSAFAANQESCPVKLTDCLNTGALNIPDDKIAGSFSGGVYTGKFDADRCVNAGVITCGNPIFSVLREGAVARLNQCYAVKGTYPFDMVSWRSSGTYTYTFNGVSDTSARAIQTVSLSTLEDLKNVSAFSATWGTKIHNGKSVTVPLYFADEAITQQALRSLIEQLAGVYAGSGEDKGHGEYTVTRTGTTLSTAQSIVSSLESRGFVKVYENTVLGDVYLAQLTKGDSLVSVNQLIKQSKTVISAMANQPLSDHLIDQYRDTAKSGAQNSLHMIKMNYFGDSFVIKLKNSHFIVIDGGIPSYELGDLLTYIESITPAGQKPVIEAWLGTHMHADHTYVVAGFNDHPGWTSRLSVEAFYFNEPSDGVNNLDSGVYKEIAATHKAISLLRTADGEVPKLYRPTIGQRYWFCDVSVDIVLSQEMIPLGSYTGGFNDSSTFYLITLDGKTFLDGGDGHQADMTFLMNTYDYTDMQVDYFKALHHGYNTWNNFTNWVSSGSTASTSVKGFRNILFPTSEAGQYNSASGSSGANAYLRSHASGTCYYAYLGTQVITFTAVTTASTAQLVSIEVISGGRDVYEKGEALDTSGLRIGLNYSNGDGSSFTKTVTEGFDGFTFGYDFSSEGEKTVTVGFDGLTDTFTVTVVPPPFTYGDLNNSGTIDTVDLSILRQYLAGSAGLIMIEEAADTNGSGTVDTVDLSILRQYLAGGAAALGPSA